MNKYIIWSDIDVQNEKEYAVKYESYLKDNELQVPENSKDYERGLFEFIYHLNNEYLDDLRTAFNMLCDMPIIVIADLGRWNGRVSGYKMINSCSKCIGYYDYERLGLIAVKEYTLTLKYKGKDSWGRYVYEDQNGKLWKHIDCLSSREKCIERQDTLYSAYNNEFEGEPDCHMNPICSANFIC